MEYGAHTPTHWPAGSCLSANFTHLSFLFQTILYCEVQTVTCPIRSYIIYISTYIKTLKRKRFRDKNKIYNSEVTDDTMETIDQAIQAANYASVGSLSSQN